MDIETLADSTGEWEAIMADMLAEGLADYNAAMSQLMADSEAVTAMLDDMLKDSHETLLDSLLIDHEKRYLFSRDMGDARRLGVGAGRSRGRKNKPLLFVGHGRQYKVTTG